MLGRFNIILDNEGHCVIIQIPRPKLQQRDLMADQASFERTNWHLRKLALHFLRLISSGIMLTDDCPFLNRPSERITSSTSFQTPDFFESH